MYAWDPVPALPRDVDELEVLIQESVFQLQKDYYTQDQMTAALGCVFGVDMQLVQDKTYFKVEKDGGIIGCGGWSFRKSLFGGSAGRSGEDSMLSPEKDAARVRAFFVKPQFALMGISSAILRRCENEISEKGFSRIVISATLPGIPFYRARGYQEDHRYTIELDGAAPMLVAQMTKKL